MSQHIDISYQSIFRVLLVLAGLTFLYFIRDVLALIFVSLFLSAAISPWVKWMHKRSIPKGLSVVIIYLAAFLVIALIVFLIIPPLSQQINQLAGSFPDYLQQIVMGFSEVQQFNLGSESLDTVQDYASSLQATFASLTEGIFSTLASVFGGIIFFLATLVLTFYMVTNEDLFIKFLHQVSPKKHAGYIETFIKRVQVKLGQWLRGQLLLMFVIFVLTLVSLMIFGVKFALVLALIAGLLELIPIAGPILASVPAIIIALSQSPITAVIVIVIYIVVQQIENNFLVPKVMQRAVGLNPIITILAILIGVKLGGILGAIVAVPVATVINMLLGDWRASRRSHAAAS
jgi:predicted PurR-regulated permease PerM